MTMSAGQRASKLPFDSCFPAHLKYLLRELSVAIQAGDAESFAPPMRRVFDFLLHYWTGAALGALDRLQAKRTVELPEDPDWSDTLKLLRYSVMAWEGHPQSSFRTLLRLGYFEAGDPPRPRLQCRWLGIAGEWVGDAASADQTEVWEGSGPLPGEPARYLEVLGEWLRASRALFVKLNRRYTFESDSLVVTLEDGRGKQLPLLPAPRWERYVAHWTLDQIELVESVSEMENLPELQPETEIDSWLDESLDDILALAPTAEVTEDPAPDSPPESEISELVEPSEPVMPARPVIRQDDLDTLLGLDSNRSSQAPVRGRPRPLEFPASLPAGVRAEMEVSRRALLDYGNCAEENENTRQKLAAGMVTGLSCLLELTARVACAGLAQVGPLPEPLRVALQQPVPAGQSVKLLHFAWTALSEYPKQVATSLLQSLFFELSAPDVPRQHARWLGLPDAPLIGLQHVTFWTRLAQGQIQSSESEFQVQLRELLDAIQLWLVAGSPLWSACDPELYIRPDGHWSGSITLGNERFQLDPDSKQEEPLEVLLERWQSVCQRQRPPFFVLDEVLEFVESVAPGSGLIVQSQSCVGKSFLLRDLALRQPQVGPYRCGWVRVFSREPLALEELNYEIERLHQEGFPWCSLGAAALADLQRHSPREQLFPHYFAALQERNQKVAEDVPVRIVLLEDDVEDVQSLQWCHVALPSPFLWVATTRSELPSTWEVPCPPARLPVDADELAFQKVQLDFWQEVLDWSKPQLLELLRRSDGNLSVQKLWAGALESELVASWKELPEPDQAARFVLSKVLEDRLARPVILLLSLGEQGLPLGELIEGPWASGLRQLLQHYSWLVVAGEDSIRLRQADWVQAVVQLGGPERTELLAQFCQYLLVKLNTSGNLRLELKSLLDWITAARAGEAAWSALQSSAFRAWKEEQVHLLDGSGQGHRKVALVASWLAVLELALQWGREKSPLQLHQVLEEQLWSYSSRGLTYRGLGRLHEALLDVEQAIAGFRPLVDQRPELLNGLAAAFNRRSEILRELGRHSAALQDADQAIQMYSQIADSEPARWGPLLALTVHHRSLLYQEMGRLEDAESDLKRALELYLPYRESLRPRMRMDLVQAYLSRAQLAARRGDGLLARDDAQRCLELLQRFQENWTELRVLGAQAQTQLAEAHRLLEDEARALEASDCATQLWQGLIEEGRIDLRGVYAQELSRRGQLLYSVAQLEAAFEAAQPAAETLLQLVEAEGRVDLTTALSQALLLRGRIWQRRGRAESAKRDLALAFHYLSNLSSQWDVQPNNPAVDIMVDTVVLLSQIHLGLGQREQAVDQLKTSLHWTRQGVEHTQQENRALLESLLGRAEQAGEEALQAHQRALDLYNELVDEQGQYQLLPRLAEAHLGRARTYRLLGEEELALADANQAVDLVTFLSEKGGDPGVLRLLPAARFEAAEILGLLGQTERALEHIQGGLQDLELLEPDFGRAEFLLERARALSLQAGLVADDEASPLLKEALQWYEQARSEGAEVRYLEADVRRRRAEVLLRLGQTAEAVEELLGESGLPSDQAGRLEQAGTLLQNMLVEACQQASTQGPTEAASTFERLIQVGEALYHGEASSAVAATLLQAYREKALATWDPQQPEIALQALSSSLALCVSLKTDPGPDTHFLMAQLLETRATLAAQIGRTTSVALDSTLALECLTHVKVVSPERILTLLWLRIQLAPLDPATWLDLSRVGDLLRTLPQEIEWAGQRARLARFQADWMRHQGQHEDALKCLDAAIESLKAIDEQTAFGPEMLELLLFRFRLTHSLENLLQWALWLGDRLQAQPQLGERIGLAPLWSWLQDEETKKEQLEEFSQVWLALLAENSNLPERLFELVPFCVMSLRLDEFDSSAWASLLDILDKRVNQPEATRLSWEGKTLLAILDLPRAEVARNPDLDMALADCLRRWSELPPHRLALAGVSADALGDWLMA